ncbi:MAG: alcohol acetyltransferase [Oscillospiraceae bacterium]|jgi:NRPS condensation-like uncharacterized protein|nr:alcohol acetyltransferase [Oscillospiraceae bacterium]
MEQWYKLDNTAKLFPAVSKRKNSSVFRASAVLNAPINPVALQQAVNHIYDRFPMLFTRLHNGVFWNYMEERANIFLVKEDTDYPCAKINFKENNGYMLRVLYFGSRISAEFFHTLTDGNGAFEFLKSLIFYYLRFNGEYFKDEGKVITAETRFGSEETSDGYQKYFSAPSQSSNLPKEREKSAYRISGTLFLEYGNNLTTGTMSASALNALAKRHNASITSYLAAVMVHSILQNRNLKDRRPIVLTVPVNLRRQFPINSLRNFFCVVNLSYAQNQSCDFDDIVKSMTTQLKEKTTKENLQRIVAKNLAFEQSALIRWVPLFIKRMFMIFGFDLMGERKKTITLTNTGRLTLPEGMKKYINRFELTSYPTPRSPMFAAVCTFDDTLTLTFGRAISETDIIRSFFMFLSNAGGLQIEMSSNDWGL